MSHGDDDAKNCRIIALLRFSIALLDQEFKLNDVAPDSDVWVLKRMRMWKSDMKGVTDEVLGVSKKVSNRMPLEPKNPNQN